MAYTYVRAIGKRKALGSRWQAVDISDIPIYELYRDFRDIMIELSHVSLSEPHIISLYRLPVSLDRTTLTITAFLNSLGNAALMTKPGTAETHTRTVDYRDAWMAGFNVERTRIGSHPDNPWGTEQRTDLLMTRSKTDYETLYQSCLVTVNGFLHATSLSEHGLYVVDGAKQYRHKPFTHIALMDFSAIGDLTFINLTREMVTRSHESNPIYQNCYLNLGVDTTHKSVIFSIGGYLHVLDSLITQTGTGRFYVDFNRYPMIQRYYESMHHLDLSALGLQIYENNPTQRHVSELLKTEETYYRLLELSQSFAIVVDTDNLYIDRHRCEDSQLPGVFYTQYTPRWPLQTQRGKLKEYWAYEDHGKWVLSCDSNLVPRYTFETMPYESLAIVTDQKISYQPYYADRGYLLEIGTDL